MKSLRNAAFVLLSLSVVAAAPLSANDLGKITGVVADPAGNPQMGASVWLTPEFGGGRVLELLTDENGIFVGQRLSAGSYTLKVTLAGFMPSIQSHVAIRPNVTTSLHVEMNSVFASLDRMRKPSKHSEPDDWKWVLRTASATRPVLELKDGTVVIANNADAADQPKQPRASLELTNGSIRPGAASALPGNLGTAVSYDQSLGARGKLLMAGEVDYDQTEPGVMGGSVAALWLPGGKFGEGPETTLNVRQIRFGDQGRSIRTMRFEHTERMAVTDRVVVEYGGEYLSGGLIGAMTSSVRPHARINAKLSDGWNAVLLLETDPDAYGLREQQSAIQPAIEALQSGPVIVWGGGRPVLNVGWHEEVSVRHAVGRRGKFEAAAFQDDNGHEAVFGMLRQASADSAIPPGLFAGPIARDAGGAQFWGTRIVYREKLTDDIEIDGVYAWAGALVAADGASASPNLPDAVLMRYRHSVAARLAGVLPKTKTQFVGSYKWIDGTVLSRQDLYGESAMGIDPNLSVAVRQPLPSFLLAGHWEALADFRNILAQGYVPLDLQDGRMLVMPVERSFRGGLSFQF